MKKIMLLILTVLLSGSSIQSSEHISDYLHAVRPLFFALPPHIPTASPFSLIGLVEYTCIAAYSLTAGFAVSNVVSVYKKAAQKKEKLINCLLPYVYCEDAKNFRALNSIISIAVHEPAIARLLPEYLAKNNDDVTMQARVEYIKKYVWAPARTKLLEHLKAEQKDREQLIQSFAEATKYNNNQGIERDWAKFNVIPAHRVHRVYDKDIRGTFKCHDIVVTGNIDNFNVELFLYSSEFLNCNDNGGLNFNFKDEPLEDSDGEHICLSVIKENHLVKKAAIYDNRDYCADRNGKNMKEHNLTPDELLRLNTQIIKHTFYDRHCETQKEGLRQAATMIEQPREMEGDIRWVSPWYFYPFVRMIYGKQVVKKLCTKLASKVDGYSETKNEKTKSGELVRFTNIKNKINNTMPEYWRESFSKQLQDNCDLRIAYNNYCFALESFEHSRTQEYQQSVKYVATNAERKTPTSRDLFKEFVECKYRSSLTTWMDKLPYDISVKTTDKSKIILVASAAKEKAKKDMLSKCTKLYNAHESLVIAAREFSDEVKKIDIGIAYNYEKFLTDCGINQNILTNTTEVLDSRARQLGKMI